MSKTPSATVAIPKKAYQIHQYLSIYPTPRVWPSIRSIAPVCDPICQQSFWPYACRQSTQEAKEVGLEKHQIHKGLPLPSTRASKDPPRALEWGDYKLERLKIAWQTQRVGSKCREAIWEQVCYSGFLCLKVDSRVSRLQYETRCLSGLSYQDIKKRRRWACDMVAFATILWRSWDILLPYDHIWFTPSRVAPLILDFLATSYHKNHGWLVFKDVSDVCLRLNSTSLMTCFDGTWSVNGCHAMISFH